jgi:hypothetical protein
MVSIIESSHDPSVKDAIMRLLMMKIPEQSHGNLPAALLDAAGKLWPSSRR